MVLDKKEFTVAYRCPECGNLVMSMVGIFALTGDMIRLKCDCGASHLDLVYNKDKKVTFRIPCIFCPDDHQYTLSLSMLLSRDLTTLQCKFTGMDICFIGKKKDVDEAIAKSNKELMELYEQSAESAMEEDEDYDEDDDFEEDENGEGNVINEEGKANVHFKLPPRGKKIEPFAAEVVEYILYMVSEFADEDRIRCGCEEGETPEYVLEINEDHVLLKCSKCGRLTMIPFSGMSTAERIFSKNELILK